MGRYLWLLGLLLGVPALAFGVAAGIRAHADGQIQSAIQQQHPEVSAEDLARVTLANAARLNDPGLDEIRGLNSTLNLMSTGAVVAAALGLGLILITKLAGLAARGNRTLLLLLFKPGLYMTAGALVALVLLHATLFIAALYYGESELINRVHVGVILAVGLGALGGVAAIASNTFGVVKKAESIAVGVSLSREQAPRLWEKITGTADRMKALNPDHIVVGLDPNFYVTEANVTTMSGQLTGRTLYCSLPLARLLTMGEFTAILGHELGHFRGEDTKFSERFYPIYRGTAASLQSLQAAGGEGSGSIALLPAIVILSHFLESFAVAENKLGRERELVADQAGVEVTDTRTMGTALVKVHAFSDLWGEFRQAALKKMREKRVFINASAIFADAATGAATPSVLEGIADVHLSHPTDTHPPLAVRLKALGTDLATLAADSLVVTPSDAAVTLVDDYESHEQEVSQVFQLLLAREHGIDLTEEDGSEEAEIDGNSAHDPATDPAAK